MKRFKKVASVVLTVALVMSASAYVYAEDIAVSSEIVTEIAGEEVQEPASAFASYSGEIKELIEFINADGTIDPKQYTIVIEDSASGVIHFTINIASTYIVDGAELKVGDKITGFFDATAPTLMIYPPKHEASVIAVYDDSRNIKVDVFDENLVSADNMLKVIIGEDTEIVQQNGEAFAGEMVNRKLVVEYTASTKSIPAQAVASKIVILYEKAIHPIFEFDEDAEATVSGVELREISVNGSAIEALAPYYNDEKIVMLPLRAVVEALGMEVLWNAETSEITIGDILLKSYEAVYTKDGAEGALETKLENVEGRTFVPLSFFEDVMEVESAVTVDGQISISK